MARNLNLRVAEGPGCSLLYDMYRWVVNDNPSCWAEIENRFLAAMWSFDQAFAAGITGQGNNQKGKGDFFTDLITLLLENGSGKELHSRNGVRGRIFPSHNLDTSYPVEGPVEIMIETRVAGAPKSPRNPQQKNPRGRPGSSDLDKRIKEVGLKAIDVKADWARHAYQEGEPASDFLTWLRQSKPLSFLFLAIRVVDRNDLERTLSFANTASQMMDGVGLVAYEPKDSGGGYQVCKIPPHLELDRVLSRVCTALRNLP